MTITLPWGREEADYVAALLRERAQGKVEMAAILQGGSILRDLRSDLGTQAVMIEGMVTDLLHAEVTNEREDDLGEDSAGYPDLQGLDP